MQKMEVVITSSPNKRVAAESPRWNRPWARHVATGLAWTFFALIHVYFWWAGLFSFMGRPRGLTEEAVMMPAALLPAVQSSFHCTGSGPDDGHCVFHNVMVKDGHIWVFADDNSTSAESAIPPLLCSAVNQPEGYVAQCRVQFARLEEAEALLGPDGVSSNGCKIDRGVMIQRLCPMNAYHTLFEDMIPAYGMMREGAHLSADAVEAARQLQEHRWGLLISDGIGHQLDATFWADLLPEVRVVHPGEGPCWVKQLVAGTRAACTHWGHCNQTRHPTPTFSPPDAAVALRDLLLHQRLQKSDGGNGTVAKSDETAAVASVDGPTANGEGKEEAVRRPRVMVVQRNKSRILGNLEEMKDVLRGLGVPSVSVVDFAGLTPTEQMRLASAADVVVMVHGGALANVLWLPRGAMLVDIYPYPFKVGHQSALIHSIRHALSPLGIGHLPFEIETSEGQMYEGKPLPTNCRCQGPGYRNCEVSVFWGTSEVRVDIERFRRHMAEALRRWQDQDYDPPLSNAAWHAIADAHEQESMAVNESVPNCI